MKWLLILFFIVPSFAKAQEVIDVKETISNNQHTLFFYLNDQLILEEKWIRIDNTLMKHGKSYHYNSQGYPIEESNYDKGLLLFRKRLVRNEWVIKVN